MQLVLTPDLILEAYRHGLFPMAYSAHSPYVHWLCPDKRGQLSINDMHIPRRLEKTVKSATKKNRYDIRINTAFRAVMEACAEPYPGRPESWINTAIINNFTRLNERGYGHSVECWDTSTGGLVGGVYGLAIGGAFFGESMFSRTRDTSKIALVHLVARLWKGGFVLLDTQFINDHLEQFGAYELSHFKYQEKLQGALRQNADFYLKGLNQDDIVLEYLEMRRKA